MTVAPVETLDVSVLVPAKDEAENLPEFVQRCAQALGPAGFSFEVIVVNDGSRDGTDRVLRELSRKYPFLSVVTHRRQRGIADALRSAGDVARGDVFVFYPADLQYLPEDIPALVAPILEGRADIVTGTKQGKYEKAFVSRVYNGLCRWLFGVRVARPASFPLVSARSRFGVGSHMPAPQRRIASGIRRLFDGSPV